ncbi:MULTISPECIES: TM2 domain-containing protein [Nocardia]|uniref:TM2 domain-containing protein n=1 Tax=Nocardia sputorum TaxID=2984338 RepID=A0ABN6U968_9NOCA|nr:TM2 domain-containing protein [Nocardia sputorum]BDT95437.1 hypothetical protein IFM12275_54130 [Nocardia sputorum]BDU01310.1 hypothetical protein IFM12276_43380 [Nocardia sputorum]
MTDPYQQNPSAGGPQYGPPGTGPDLTKPLDAQSQPQYSPPSDPYGQPQYGQPVDAYGQQPGGYPPAPYPGVPQGYNPNDPEAPWGRDPFGAPLSDKQKLVAGLLQIFLGSFGVGRFYLGYTGLGIAQLVVSVLTCFTVGWIWGIVDGILMLTGKVPDSNGRPLRD